MADRPSASAPDEAGDLDGDEYGFFEEFASDDKGEPEGRPAADPDDDGEAGDEQDVDDEIEIPGVGKFTPSQIKELTALQARLAEIEKRESDAKAQMETVESQSQELEGWRELDRLAREYPTLRTKLNAVLKEAVDTGAIGPKAPGDKGLDTAQFRPAKPAVDEETRDAIEWVNQQKVEKAGQEIATIVSAYAEKYPDDVKASGDWISNVLAPAVRERFGEEVGPKEIRMTLNDLIMEGGAVDRADKAGQSRALRALAKEPAGTRVVPAGGSRKQSKPVESDPRGKSWGDLQSELAETL